MVGVDSINFTIEVHHGGFFYGLCQNRAYLNEKVDYFDDCKVELWTFMGIEEITMMLDYGLVGKHLKVYRLLPGKDLSDGLRIINSDEDTIIMVKLTNQVKTFVLYYDHNYHVGNTNLEDIVINPRKVDYIPMELGETLHGFYSNLQRSSGTGLKAEIESDEDNDDPDFCDSDYEVQEDDDDLFCDDVDEVYEKKGFANNNLEEITNEIELFFTPPQFIPH